MQNFKVKEEITKAVDAVMKLFEPLERGEILHHQKISRVLKLRPHEGMWDHVMNRARRKLENERGIATWPELSIGYKLMTQDEQFDIPRRRTKRSIRQSRMALRSIEALPVDDLSPFQQRTRAFLGDQLQEMEQRLRRDMRSQIEATRTERMPLRPEVAAMRHDEQH